MDMIDVGHTSGEVKQFRLLEKAMSYAKATPDAAYIDAHEPELPRIIRLFGTCWTFENKAYGAVLVDTNKILCMED
jgi:hypothetical protein